MKKLIVCIILFAGYNSAADESTFEIIREHSRVAFDVDYMTVAKVDGIFKDFYGNFNFIEKTNEISNVNVDIIAKSVDTNDSKRDFHLRGQEFFLVETNPIINFKYSGKAVLTPDKSFSLPGVIKLRGMEKPFVLKGQYIGKNKDAWDKYSYFFKLTGVINRKEFNMSWNKALDNGGYLLGEKVNVNITLQAQVLGDKTAFSTHMIPSTKGIIEREMLRKGKIKKLTTSTDPKDHPETLKK